MFWFKVFNWWLKHPLLSLFLFKELPIKSWYIWFYLTIPKTYGVVSGSGCIFPYFSLARSLFLSLSLSLSLSLYYLFIVLSFLDWVQHLSSRPMVERLSRGLCSLFGTKVKWGGRKGESMLRKARKRPFHMPDCQDSKGSHSPFLLRLSWGLWEH